MEVPAERIEEFAEAARQIIDARLQAHAGECPDFWKIVTGHYAREPEEELPTPSAHAFGITFATRRFFLHAPNQSAGGNPTMADNRPNERSDNRPGSSQTGGSSGGGAGLGDQARDALNTATSTASDAWDSASRYGSRYYRQGSRAVSDMDSGTMMGWLVAGAIGLGLGWLAFGQRSYSGDYIPRRMSRSSDRDY